MDNGQILERIRTMESPLKRQLLMVGLITRILEERGRPSPILIGGGALSYYTREVYFTSDIDLAYGDRDTLDAVLRELGFLKQGRYWLQQDLDIALEVPVTSLPGEDSPIEIAELGDGLVCRIIGMEDLIIDRLNACKHWKSKTDCEMTELLILKYGPDLDWEYLEHRAARPENDTVQELAALRTISRHER